MSWLCEVCGYENPFDDGEQSTECLCCGEPASKKILSQARQELEAYHRAERERAQAEQARRQRELEAYRRAEREKARAELARKQQELRQKRIESIAKHILSLEKAVSIAVMLATAAALVWAALALGASGMSFDSRGQQMWSNISALHLEGSALSVLRNSAEHISVQTKERCSRLRVNIASVIQKDVESFRDCLHGFIGSVFTGGRHKSVAANTLRLCHSLAIEQTARTDHMKVLGGRTFDAGKNFAFNFKFFWNRAADNVNGLIEKIAERGVGAGA